MTGVDIFILFVLPTLILIGSLVGLKILNRPAQAAEHVDAAIDYSKVVRFPAVGE